VVFLFHACHFANVRFWHLADNPTAVPSENVIRNHSELCPVQVHCSRVQIPCSFAKFPVPLSRQFCSKSAESLDEWRHLIRVRQIILISLSFKRYLDFYPCLYPPSACAPRWAGCATYGPDLARQAGIRVANIRSNQPQMMSVGPQISCVYSGLCLACLPMWAKCPSLGSPADPIHKGDRHGCLQSLDQGAVDREATMRARHRSEPAARRGLSVRNRVL
jgi:hypothetical protein